MPLKKCNPVDERLKSVARLLDGQKMAIVCRDCAGHNKSVEASNSPLICLRMLKIANESGSIPVRMSLPV